MRIKGCLFVVLLFIAGLFPISTVNALSGSVALDKAYLEGLYGCYNNGHIRTGTGSQSPITLENFPVFANGPTSWTDNVNGTKNSFLIIDDADGLVLLPTGLAGIDDDNLRCNELFIGYNGAGGKFDGLLKMAGVSNPAANATPEVKSTFLSNLGYTASTTNNTTGTCSSLNLTMSHSLNGVVNSGDVRSYSLCGSGLDNGGITSSTSISVSANGGDSVLSFSVDGRSVTVSYPTIVSTYNSSRRMYQDQNSSASFSVKLDDYSTWDEFMDAIALQLSGKTIGSFESGGGDGGTYVSKTTYALKLTDTFTSSPTTEVFKTFTIPSKTSAASKAMQFFMGSPNIDSYDDLVYSDAQKVALYQTYLTETFQIKFFDDSCVSVTESESERIVMSGYKKVNWNTNGGSKVCFVQSDKEGSVSSVNGIKSNGHFGEKIETDASKTAFQKLIDELNSITLVENEYAEENGAEDDFEALAEQDPCYNAGIEGMSWILCPSLNNMVSATDGISWFIDEWLEVDSDYYSDGSEARQAWGYFRDMANVAVIIVLLIVIVSQVTGYGIDNYGIKKILPRLLVMAVLINLSFLMCQLAIDISNLLGTGLNDLFKSIGLTVNSSVGGKGITAGIVDALFVALAGAGVVAAPLITIGTLTGGFSTFGPMAIIFIVLMVVTALIAVVMFFLALGARFIIILVFTAIAPLAFACFILPNTQSLFKKWWDVFKTALLIYPICGALYGASFIIRAIIFNDGDVKFSMAMIAIAAPFLPFLVLPKLTAGAIAGLGVIGSALSGIRSGIKSGFSKGETAIQNTASFKAAQEQGQRNMNYKTAGFKFNRKTQQWEDNSGNIRGFGRFLRGGKLGMSQARGRVLADERARVSEGGLMGAGFEAGMVAQKKAAEAEEVGNWETLLKDKTNDGANEEELFKEFHKYMGEGNKYAARAVARIAGRRKDTAASFMREFAKNTDFSTSESKVAAASVAKEIAEGANSRMYLSAAPLQFDFASQINKNGDNASFKYDGDGGWLSQTREKKRHDGTTYEVTMADDAVNNYVTDSNELVGVKNNMLEEINDLIGKGGISQGEAKRLEILATETIANRDKGPWDSTKAEELCRMSNGAFKFENGQIIDMRGGVQRPAVEGEVLNIHNNDGSAASKIIAGPEVERQFREGRRDGSIQLPK